MIVFVPIEAKENSFRQILPRYDGIKMSLEEFLHWEPEPELGVRYEWNNGIVEAEEKMKIEEGKVFRNLLKVFVKTKSFENGDALLSEIEIYLKQFQKIRKPDICFLTKKQLETQFPKDSEIIPEFIIEIMSPTNTVDTVETKLQEYFYSGTKVVWLIYPKIKQVKVYFSVKEIKVCTDSDVCETKEVIPDFQISVNEIFV